MCLLRVTRRNGESRPASVSAVERPYGTKTEMSTDLLSARPVVGMRGSITMSHRTRKRGIAAERTRVQNAKIGNNSGCVKPLSGNAGKKAEVDRLIAKYKKNK